MRAMVTGGTGFIGSALVKELLNQGNEVACLVRQGSTTKRISNVIYIEDSESQAQLTQAFLSFGPDVVFHLAACQDLTNTLDGAKELLETNLYFGSRVLTAASDSGAKSFISAGTFSTHATGTSEFVPQTFYASTKIAFMNLCEFFATTTSMKTLVLELSDTYGPKDPRVKFLNLISQFSKSGETIGATAGEQFIRPLHVDDVVSGFIHAATLHLSGRKLDLVLSLAGAEEVNLKELVKIFESATGRKVNVTWGERPYRKNEIMKPYVGNQLPDWKPAISLAQGLAQVFSD